MWLTELRIILPDGEIANGSLQIVDQQIEAILPGAAPTTTEPMFATYGLIAIPGLVDLAGDLFEREMEPRPGSLFPLDAAIHEFEKRLVGAGIVTCGVVVTLDAPVAHWRSRRPEQVRAAIDAIAAQEKQLLVQLLIHLRVDAAANDALPTALGLIQERRCNLLGLRGLTEHSAALAAAAADQGLPLVLHEPKDPAEVRNAYALGARICCLPASPEASNEAHALGMRVAISAPNILRHKVETGHIRQQLGQAQLLVADESPRALLQAVFQLHQTADLPLYRAIALACHVPACLLGQESLGLTPGAKADLVLIEPGPIPHVRMVIRNGEIIYRRG